MIVGRFWDARGLVCGTGCVEGGGMGKGRGCADGRGGGDGREREARQGSVADFLREGIVKRRPRERALGLMRDEGLRFEAGTTNINKRQIENKINSPKTIPSALQNPKASASNAVQQNPVPSEVSNQPHPLPPRAHSRTAPPPPLLPTAQAQTKRLRHPTVKLRTVPISLHHKFD